MKDRDIGEEEDLPRDPGGGDKDQDLGHGGQDHGRGGRWRGEKRVIGREGSPTHPRGGGVPGLAVEKRGPEVQEFEVEKRLRKS